MAVCCRRVHSLFAVAAAVAALTLSTARAADEANATGLPTYPHIARDVASMDATYRCKPNGQHWIHFSAKTEDPLATVEAWDRAQLPGAQSTDAHKIALYGSSFKYEGISCRDAPQG